MKAGFSDGFLFLMKASGIRPWDTCSRVAVGQRKSVPVDVRNGNMVGAMEGILGDRMGDGYMASGFSATWERSTGMRALVRSIREWKAGRGRRNVRRRQARSGDTSPCGSWPRRNLTCKVPKLFSLGLNGLV